MSLKEISDVLEDVRDRMPDAHERCANECMKAIWTNLDPMDPDIDMPHIARVAAIQGKHMQFAIENVDLQCAAEESKPTETDYVAKHLDEIKGRR
jgi:hypothetical protein